MCIINKNHKQYLIILRVFLLIFPIIINFNSYFYDDTKWKSKEFKSRYKEKDYYGVSPQDRDLRFVTWHKMFGAPDEMNKPYSKSAVGKWYKDLLKKKAEYTQEQIEDVK